jgi:arylsulfatase
MVWLNSCQPAPSKPDPSPNILLILVDDMGYSDLSCYGSEIATPNIDSVGGFNQAALQQLTKKNQE